MLLWLAVVLLAQKKRPQFTIDRRQKGLQMDAAGGEVEGEVLGLGLSALQHGAAGVVEGVVGGIIVFLPAVTA